MLEEREALEEALAAVAFHQSALETIEADRRLLNGPFGLLTRLFRTHKERTEVLDAHSRAHLQHLQQHQARVKQCQAQLDERRRKAQVDRDATVQERADLERCATALAATNLPQALSLRTIDAQLTAIEQQRQASATLHRLGSALVVHLRKRTNSKGGFLTRRVADVWNATEDGDAMLAEFAAAARAQGHLFEVGTDAESLIMQSEAILFPLQEAAFEAARERRLLDAARLELLRDVAKSPFAQPIPDVVPTQKVE